MALQINWTDPATKVLAPTAYARTLFIYIDIPNGTVDAGVGFYVNQAARAAGGTPIAVSHFSPPVAAVASAAIPIDLQTSLYSYLKTLPTFSGALDV